MLQQPKRAEVVEPSFLTLALLRAAEHLGDSVPAAGAPGLHAGDAAEDDSHGAENVVVDRRLRRSRLFGIVGLNAAWTRRLNSDRPDP